jgi:BON domain-containing protein
MRSFRFGLAFLSLAVLTSSGLMGDDQQIAQQIIERLQAEKKAGTLKGFSIDLQVDDGTVWLSGRVTSDQQQARALDLARRVGGVKQVVNDLAIAEAPPRAVAAAQPTPAPAPAFAAAPAATVAQAQAAPQMVQAVPIASQPVASQSLAASQQDVASLVAAGPATQAATAEQKPFSPAQNSVLNNVSKTIMTAVHGNQPTDSRQVAAASPIGSGVDPTAASSRRSVVQTAQPIANAPQQLATADGLQPVMPAAPQMMAYMPMQMPYAVPVYAGSQMQVPLAVGQARPVQYMSAPAGVPGSPMPSYLPGSGVGIAPARYDHPTMPGYAWPSYAAAPNYAAVTYPKQYSPTAWPYIGPFYPYPQVPLGWRKVTLEWDDGWWFLDFKDRRSMYNK